MSDPRLGQVAVDVRRTPCSFQDCKTHLSHPWYPTMKDTCKHPKYGIVYDYKYSLTFFYIKINVLSKNL